jgi:hypothetical protein
MVDVCRSRESLSGAFEPVAQMEGNVAGAGLRRDHRAHRVGAGFVGAGLQAIANAARELVQLRETQSSTRTLTQLYNERPTWLDNARRKLDAAVFAAYGWPVDLSDDEILARLLALNLVRAFS